MEQPIFIFIGTILLIINTFVLLMIFWLLGQVKDLWKYLSNVVDKTKENFDIIDNKVRKL